MSAVTSVTQAYRFALDPTPAQVRDLHRHAGASRFAFNWALAAVRANLAQRDAERSYGIADSDLTPPLGWNLPALRRAWNQAKDDVAPWWSECSKEAYNTGLDGVARALRNFADSKRGKRKGKPVGFPRFRSRRCTPPSTRFTTGAIRVEPDRHHVTLPRVGTIKTHENTRRLERRLANGTARILSATVRHEAGRWHVAFTVEVTRSVSRPARPDAVIGVDVGITHLAVLSTGEIIANPRHLERARRQLARLSRRVARRRGPDRRAGQRPSKRWERANAMRNWLHHRVTHLRRDGLHKLTTRLAAEYGTVVVEDLNVTGMVGNRRLARFISDAGFATIRRLLDYKTRWNGGHLLIADRWYPSSKTCSSCQTVKPKLSLAERTFTCDVCGLSLDRDLNAALNLEQYVARSGRETVNGRGADRKTTPVVAGGCEASTPQRASA
ncbi:IS607 family element RNA-guided endonuclease TnpB [Nocardia vinacea]|uniref:IS607 family element RNA-guided endonuclease TnpB n=1 Tax=Nocardia vinacea TaxID=96468 RepID=UPI002E1118C6|nr:IS607 family element RNA-guided endonuclease TnpB [Nocardia vinacea]